MPDSESLGPALIRALDRVVTVRSVDPIGSWAVSRVHLEPSADLPATVIVKWRRPHDPSKVRTDIARLTTERDALRLLEFRGIALAPRLLGFDSQLGLLVIEDLVPAVPLSDILGTDRDGAREGLVAFARTMGTLHAATAEPGGREESWEMTVSWDWHLPDFATYGITTMDSARDDMAIARQVLREPGPFIVMTNGDPGPNNFMVDRGRGRIIDWELVGFRHALIDAACLYVPGPAWLNIEDPSGTEVEDAYRQALSAGVEAATDEPAFGLALGAACLITAIDRLRRLPVLDARMHGDHSRIQMVATLKAAARVARRWAVLPHLVGWVSDAATNLRARWPDADVDLPDAYTRRAGA